MTLLSWLQIGPNPGNTRFFESPGLPAAPAIRGDRAFFGGAKAHGQQVAGSVTGGSWLQSFAAGADVITGWGYLETQARVVAVSDFGIALSGAARTSSDQIGIGVSGVVLVDGATGKHGWGGYFDAVRTSPLGGNASGVEINATQKAGIGPGNGPGVVSGLQGRTPYKTTYVGDVVGIRLAAGSDQSIFSTSNFADAAIEITSNGSMWAAGIDLRHNAIRREFTPDDGTPVAQDQGYGAALRTAYKIGWSGYSRDPLGIPGSGTQQEAMRIYSSIISPTVKIDMTADDAGIRFFDPDNLTGNLARIDLVAGAASWPVLTPSTNTYADFAVRGVSGNTNLRLVPQGVGTVIVPLANTPAFVDSAAAALGGVSLGGLYYNSTIGAISQRRA